MRFRNTSGVAVATAAALLFGTGLVSTAAAGTDGKVHCSGVNACKGQNSCKGKGFLEMSKQECKDAKAKMKSQGADK
jgi:hypothetical protein